MEVAKISSKGQITIPISIRKALNLNNGDKIVIQQENGRYYFDNAKLVAFKRVQDEFKNEALDKGYAEIEDMQDILDDARKEIRGY